MYIHKGSTISFQNTFEKTNFHSELKALTPSDKIIHPKYLEFIHPMSLRRMTDIIKMAVCCAKSCVTEETKNNVGGIVVGTAIGCSNHTLKFMDNINNSANQLVSPTSFVLSTHNTMAGQISLALDCHEYNNTHSHNSLSFENSLLDCFLLIEEGNKNILIGTSDEANEELFSTKSKIGSDLYPTTYGSTFFLVDNEQPERDKVKFVDVESLYAFDNFASAIKQFLSRNGVAPINIDKVFYSCYNEDYNRNIDEIFKLSERQAYENISGSYLTASSFAAHIGYDFLCNTNETEYVLIINNILPKNLGLTLLKKE